MGWDFVDTERLGKRVRGWAPAGFGCFYGTDDPMGRDRRSKKLLWGCRAMRPYGVISHSKWQELAQTARTTGSEGSVDRLLVDIFPPLQTQVADVKCLLMTVHCECTARIPPRLHRARTARL